MKDAFDSWFDSRPADECPADGELLTGTRIGSCRVVGLLGRGGFAEVYRGEDADGRPIAIKILHRLDDKSRARFELESKILLTVSHRNFPRIYSFGSCGERPYMVMELLQAFDLPHGDGKVAAFLRTLVGAVGELHRHGYVHRDIKPENILMRGNGEPVLVDFGLACPLSRAEREKNALSVDGRAAVGVGTYGFSAPEQFNGRGVGREADVHAVGMLIRECFGGSPPKCWREIFLTATNSEPAIRYRTVERLGEAVRRRHWRKLLAWGLGSLAVLALIALSWAHASVRERQEQKEEIQQIQNESKTTNVYDGRDHRY